MLRKIIFIGLLCFAGKITGQKVVFDVNARTNFMQPDEYTLPDTFNYFVSDRIDDTTVVRTAYTQISNRTQDYAPNLGYEVNGLFSILLAERFSLRTGIGLQFWSFSVGSENESVSSIETGKDTVYSPIPIGNPIGGVSACDCFTNSYFDIFDRDDRRIHYESINLSIPIEASYQIIPKKLTVSAGGYFHTPLYAASKRTYYTIEAMQDGDMTKCEWVRVVEKNTASTGISNFQWGVSAWLGYFILPNLQVEVGARQQMNDVYVNESQQFFQYDKNSFKPLTFSAGISYRFNLSATPALNN